MAKSATLVVLAALGFGCANSDSQQRDAGASDLAGSVAFQEAFAAADGAPWPSPWRQLGGVATATVVGGRGRLTPVASGYSLARMGISAMRRDAEASFLLRFEDVGSQGVGFYLRQNGGYLRATSTHGAGYAVFVEGFDSPPQIGVWREVDGAESPITHVNITLSSNLTYAVRFRVTQASPGVTRLQARLWDSAQAEPSAWQLDVTDGSASLQNLAGGWAVDSWSTATGGTIGPGTLVGNIMILGLN